MTNIQTNETKSNQISSRRIADFKNQKHGHVRRGIKQLNSIYKSMSLPEIEERDYIDNRGRTRQEFWLNEKQALTFAAGESPELRIFIVEELAMLKSHHPYLDREIPSNFSEALQLAADQEKKIEIDAPKVDLHDQIMNTSGLTDFDSMAKECGMNRAQIWPILRKRGYIFQKLPLPIAIYEQNGYFIVKKVDFGNGHSGDQTFFTPTGVEYFAPKLPRWFIEDGYTAPAPRLTIVGQEIQ